MCIFNIFNDDFGNKNGNIKAKKNLLWFDQFTNFAPYTTYIHYNFLVAKPLVYNGKIHIATSDFYV